MSFHGLSLIFTHSRCMRALFLALSASLCGAEETVLFLEGGSQVLKVQSINAEGRVMVEGQRTPFHTDELYQIIGSARPSTNAPLPVLVELVDGTRLPLSNFTVKDEVCRLAWALDPTLEVPLDTVHAVRMKPDRKTSAYQRALTIKREEFDQLWVEVENDLQLVKGVIELISDEKIEFEWEGARRSFTRDQVYGVLTADLGGIEAPDDSVWVDLADGSRLNGRIASLENGILSLLYYGGRKLDLSWKTVQRVTLNAGRLVFLSDLVPASEFQQPVVAPARPWQRDRSVGQQEMAIGANTYPKGIGMPSGTRLRFLAGRQYHLLNGFVGIDAETRGRGDCVLVVMGDGDELYRQRVRGSDPARELKLDIRGRELITLSVEYGAQLDLADHVDWAEVRFLKGE